MTVPELQKLALLSRISLSEEEASALLPEMDALITLCRGVDPGAPETADAGEPFPHPGIEDAPALSVDALRPDEPEECLSRESALSGAQKTEAGMFSTPRAVG